MDHEVILYQISENNETAFRELFEYFSPGLISFAASILKSKPLAEEVVTDVFVKLWENRKNVRKIRKLPVYLYKSVRYASIDAIKKQKRHQRISFDEVGDTFTFSYLPQDGALITKENCRRISEAVDQLPDKCRLIFRLIKEENMKYREVAQLLELSEKTVENQMSIAIKKLISALKADFPEYSLYFFRK